MRNFPLASVATPQLRCDWSPRFPGNHFRPDAQAVAGNALSLCMGKLLRCCSRSRQLVIVIAIAIGRVIAVAFLVVVVLLLFSCDLNFYFLSSWHKFPSKVPIDLGRLHVGTGAGCLAFGAYKDMLAQWLLRFGLAPKWTSAERAAAAVLIFLAAKRWPCLFLWQLQRAHVDNEPQSTLYKLKPPQRRKVSQSGRHRYCRTHLAHTHTHTETCTSCTQKES